MADLIDRDKLIDFIMETDPDWCVKPIRPIFDFISGMPSAQPEIIRCNDCKWWNHNTDLTYCDRFGTMWVGADPDDFCSFAERETDE